jgi:hypothetical protein
VAHLFEKPSLLVDIGLRQLQRQIVLPALIWTNPIANFGGSSNDTINVKIPAILASRARTFRGTSTARNVTADDLIESVVPVTLDDIIYSAVNLTDEQMTLDIQSFSEQVLLPQANAVAYGIENYVGTNLFTAAPYQSTHFTDPTDTYPSILDARQFLNDSNVPDAGRTLVVGSSFETVLLKDKQLRHFEYSGDQANEALRQASVMNLAGLQVIRSNALAPDEAYLFHRTAFILTNAGPVKPASVQSGASMALQGLACRWISDYDYINLQDRSLLDTYVGHAIVTEPNGSFVRATKLKLAVSAITVTPQAPAITAASGASHTVQLKVLDSNGVNRTLDSNTSYVSATTSHATVSSTGLVTGVAAGTSVVTATYVNPDGSGSLTATTTVTAS